MDDEAEVICCQGPPTCQLQDDEAVAAAKAGCPNCRHIVIAADGTEREFKIKPQ